MNVITIFQDYKTNISKFRDHFPNIEYFKPLVGSQNLILETDGSIQWKHYVGFASHKGTNIQILPKIVSDNTLDKDAEIAKSLEFLFNMLAYSGYFTHKEVEACKVDFVNWDILEIFINIYASNLLRVFNREIYQNYLTVEEEQFFIKGKIDFSKTFSKNLKPGFHWVRYQEFSINNYLNQILKSVAHRLLLRTKKIENKRKLKLVMGKMEEIDIVPLSKEIFNKVKLNRQNKSYHKLFELAKLFFNNLQPGFSFGDNDTYAFLVPINLLFENFLLRILQNSLPDFDLEYHNRKYFGLRDSKRIAPLQPDYIVHKDKKTIAVLDAKFKNPYSGENQIHVSDDNLYQLTTYSTAYDSELLFLIYPYFEGRDHKDVCLSKMNLLCGDGAIRKLYSLQLNCFQDIEISIKQFSQFFTPILSKFADKYFSTHLV